MMQQQQQQKHDIFVGNLAFSTTEEQLHQAFSELGRIIKVRMVSDLETGKPRGFAFIEFEDPQAALSAIRNMNDYELNGRRIRVNFSNSSHLETLAGKLGMDMSQHSSTQQRQQQQVIEGSSSEKGTSTIADALKSMTKNEMHNVISQLKEISDRDPDEARKLLSGHPQLPEAILHLMSKLDMIQTPLNDTSAQHVMPTTTAPPPNQLPSLMTQPPPSTTTPTDPRSAPSDPRANLTDPRKSFANHATADPRFAAASNSVVSDPRTLAANASNLPPPTHLPPPLHHPPVPPIMQPPPQYSMPPPSTTPANSTSSGLNSNLVQQVMSLTPHQIAQLPPDKQASILALRAHITGR